MGQKPGQKMSALRAGPAGVKEDFLNNIIHSQHKQPGMGMYFMNGQ